MATLVIVASKRAVRRRQCGAKVRYTEKPNPWGGMHPYRCCFCGAWHLGHRTGPGRRFRRRTPARAA